MKDTLKIFIGNLDDRATQEEVSALFEQFGPVASCAVMKQYAFVHMRGADRAQAAIDELNGRDLYGKKMVVELSKPRPQNTWKIFVGNVSAACNASELRTMFEAYGNVVECDVVKDYAFVHMENESDARNAIENLNGTEVKGKRINVEMSNKASKPMGANGNANNRARRPQEFRDMSQNRPDALNRRRAAEAAYASFALRSPFDRYTGDNATYDAFENRVRPPSPSYYPRDRSPLRRSPTRSPYGLAQSTNAFASKYRTPATGFGSLTSAYGDQTAFSSQVAAAYGNRAGAFGSAYGTQGGYESQAATYGTDTQAAYAAQSSSAYGLQASSLASNYGSQLSSMASSYSAQTPSNPYAAHSSSSPYAASSTMASAYRAPQTSAYETPQVSGLGMQSAYSSLSTPTETPMYERSRLSPSLGSSSDGFKSRLATDRRYSELAEYRRLTQESQDAFRRSPPRSQMEYRRMPESQSDYYGDYMRAAQMSGYQRRL